MAWTYILSVGREWKSWFQGSFCLAVLGMVAEMIPDDIFKFPWWGWGLTLFGGFQFAQFTVWQREDCRRLDLKNLLDGSGLHFRCGDGPPYHETEDGRQNFRIEIYNSSAVTGKSVCVHAIAIDGGRTEQLPVALRERQSFAEKVDLLPFQRVIFDVAKTVPPDLLPKQKDGVYLCRSASARTENLVWVDSRKFRLAIRSYADGIIGEDAIIEIERDASDNLIAIMAQKRQAAPSYDALMPIARSRSLTTSGTQVGKEAGSWGFSPLVPDSGTEPPYVASIGTLSAVDPPAGKFAPLGFIDSANSRIDGSNNVPSKTPKS